MPISYKPTRDQEAKLRGLAGRKGVEVRKALRSGCFRLFDRDGMPILADDGSKALTLGEAIVLLLRMPNDTQDSSQATPTRTAR